MRRREKCVAGLLACVMLLSMMPVNAMATETEECPHQYESVITAPTCMEAGYTSYQCLLCGAEYVADEVEPTGICTLASVPEVEADCAEPGIAAHYQCANCGRQYWDEAGTQPIEDIAQLELPKAKCTMAAVAEEEASCTETGVAAHYKCTNCGRQYWDEAGTQPVEDAAQLELPKAKCTMAAVAEEEASCTETGVAAHYKCTNCGRQYWDEAGTQPVENAAQLEIPVKEHAFGPWQTVTAPTPEQPGTERRQCLSCGTTEDRSMVQLTVSLSTPSLQIKANSASGKPCLSWKAIKKAKAYRVYLVDLSTEEMTLLAETSSRSYTYQEAEPGKTYTFTVVAVNATACSKYSKYKSVVCKCAKPVITISSEPVSGKPVVRWEPVEGAVSYELFRSTDNKKFKSVAKTAELSVQLDASTANKTYYYRLQAIGAAEGSNSAYSTTIKHVCDCAQPVVTTQSGATGGIRVAWEKVSGAKYYYLYRASEADGSYTKVAKTTALGYTDIKAPKNRISYYKVKAVGSKSASMSAGSEVVSAMNHTFGKWVTIVPRTPEKEGLQERTCTGCGHVESKVLAKLKCKLSVAKLSVSSARSSGKPQLSWKSVSKAKEYWVYLWDGENYTFLASTTKCKYLHQNAVPGTRYDYAIVAVNTTSCSPYSSVKTAVCRCPAPQLSIRLDEQSGAQKLIWEPVEGAEAYRVYRSSVKNAGRKVVATVQNCDWTVCDEIPGVQYYYYVQAVEGTCEDADSLISNMSYATTTDQTFVIHAGQFSPICNKIVWKKVAGASKYRVYRSTSEDGVFTRVATVSRREYLDLKVKAGTTYYYKVKAVGKKVSVTSPVQPANVPAQVPVRIYVSPSCQTGNWYAYGSTSEATQCRAIAKLTVQALERCGFAAMTNVSGDMRDRVIESNAWKAELHIPLHTNALDRKKMGTQVYYKGSMKSFDRKAAEAIYDALAPVTPGDSGEGIREITNLYEINACNAPVAYVEAAFHDSRASAKWIIENKQLIAETICQGVCNLYGVTYVAP